LRATSPSSDIKVSISNSRGTEMFLALWVRLWGALGTPHFNIHVVRSK
jgi:hypothetical protein